MSKVASRKPKRNSSFYDRFLRVNGSRKPKEEDKVEVLSEKGGAPVMKQGERARLQHARADLVRTLDVTEVLPLLMRPDMFTEEDERQIMIDPRRRERIMVFLTILERKSSETYEAFCEILEERFPHLFLLLSDWDNDDVMIGDYGHPKCRVKLGDSWGVLESHREYILNEIDAANIVSSLRDQHVLTLAQEQLILSDPDPRRRTETFLDVLELNPPAAFQLFLESISDMYPHVYLELTGDGDQANDDEGEVKTAANLDEKITGFSPRQSGVREITKKAAKWLGGRLGGRFGGDKAPVAIDAEVPPPVCEPRTSVWDDDFDFDEKNFE